MIFLLVLYYLRENSIKVSFCDIYAVLIESEFNIFQTKEYNPHSVQH